MARPAIRLTGISKQFPGTLANDGVDLTIEPGTIHALLGENGAGKTTLMNILSGRYRPDAGEIRIGAAPVRFRSPKDALDAGIGMVHQHFMLVAGLTVAENLTLGMPSPRFALRREALDGAVRRLSETYGLPVEPRARIDELSLGQQQRVEILKLLHRQADCLILDEPTAVLTPGEVDELFRTLRRIAGEGRAVVFITHKLDEVMAVADRITILRRGRRVADLAPSEVESRRELARLMVGRDVLYPLNRAKKACGAPVLDLKEVSLLQRGRVRPLLNKVNLTVHSCEIVGVAGVSGNGLGELEDVVSGLQHASSGQILHNGDDVTRLGAAELRERGMAYVPADRLHRGSSLQSSVTENMIVSNHHKFLRAGFLKRTKIQEYASGLTKSFGIDGGPRVPIGTLSGGNIQKVILARELTDTANIIVVSEPTWGLDVASSQFVYEKILTMRAAGAGVLFISSALDEILGIADIIAVMYRGRVVALLPNNQNAQNDPNVSKKFKEFIGEYMLGLRDDFAPAGPQRKDASS
jgi:general nucleoside transport system ATP-binding protein